MCASVRKKQAASQSVDVLFKLPEHFDSIRDLVFSRISENEVGGLVKHSKFEGIEALKLDNGSHMSSISISTDKNDGIETYQTWANERSAS
jgi:hypothetical protein